MPAQAFFNSFTILILIIKTINMKILFAAALLFSTGFSSTHQTVNMSMPGAYKMLSQSVKADNVDTTYRSVQ